MNQTPAKVRRKFDDAFKRAALENWHSSGKSATVIAQELGLKANRLYAWQQRLRKTDSGHPIALIFFRQGLQKSKLRFLAYREAIREAASN